jgi:hypothetical protein
MPEYRVIRLEKPETVQKHWPALRGYVLGGTDAITPETLALAPNILELILTRKMQLWILLEDGKICAVATTSVNHQFMSGTAYLTLETASMVKVTTDTAWRALLQRLERFGKEHGCFSILCYVSTDTVEAFCHATGFRSDIRMAHKEIA